MPTLAENCDPTRGNGRELTTGEWNLVIAVANDVSDEYEFSRGGVTSSDGFLTWCQLRDHPVQSTGYWFFVEDIDNIITMGSLFCTIDGETSEVTCGEGPFDMVNIPTVDHDEMLRLFEEVDLPFEIVESN